MFTLFKYLIEKNRKNNFWKIKGRALNDFQIVYHTRLSVEPQTKLTDTRVESCAEICVFDDSFFCRSFDYDTEKNTCYLYKENIVDRFNFELGIKTDKNINHYSSNVFKYFLILLILIILRTILWERWKT